VIALVGAFHLKRGKIGTRARFGKALAPAQFVAGDGRQMGKPLLLGAEFQQCGAQHHGAIAANGVEGADRGHFLGDHLGLRRAQPAPP
jgi:hypothetical protein